MPKITLALPDGPGGEGQRHEEQDRHDPVEELAGELAAVEIEGHRRRPARSG